MIKLPPIKSENKKLYGVKNKLVSGRFLLTITTAICFLKLTNTICTILLSKADVLKISDISTILTAMLIIVSNVFTFYFLKATLRNENIENNEKPTK